jgi:uncharacterized protein YjbI with pentapeptide repeats
MTNEELIALLNEGVETWNEWRRKNPDELLDLSQANLGEVDLNLANLSLANLSLANLSLANLSLANLTQANLRWANLSQANLRWADLTYANLSLANLTQANLSQATLNHANLRWADLSQSSLIGVELTGTDLSGANLSKTDFYKANLSGIDLSGTDLSGANLTEANLSGADLSGSDLRDANLSRANLENANVAGANLTGANLTGVKALGANFAQATLTQACIEGWEVDRHTNLEGAIFDHLTTANSKDITQRDAVAAQLESPLDPQSHPLDPSDALLSDRFPTTSLDQRSDLESVTSIDDVLGDVEAAPFVPEEGEKETLLSLGVTDDLFPDQPNELNGSQREEPNQPKASTSSWLPELESLIAPVPPPPPPRLPMSITRDASTSVCVELTFSNGINWPAFLLMFQALQQQYGDRALSIQAIAQEDDFAFVVRLKTPPTLDQTTLETAAGQLYEAHLAKLEATYRNDLRLTDEQIATYYQQSTDLLEMVKRQATRPIVPLSPASRTSQHEDPAIADALTAYEPPVVRSDLEGWA